MGGADSKLYYRRTVLKIGDTDLSLEGDAEFWKELLSYQGTGDDVLLLFPAADVREILSKKPNNLKVIVKKCVQTIVDAVATHKGDQNVPMSVPMNCIRMLTRIIPVMNEDVDEETDKFFWEGDEPLAEQIVKSVIDMCFLPGFTVPLKRKVDKTAKIMPAEEGGPAPELLWESGAGYVTSYPSDSTDSMDINRRDLLRCLCALIADTLYLSPQDMQTKRTKWAKFVAGYEHKHSRTLFYSLLNSGMTWNPHGPFGGWQRVFFPLALAQPVVTGRMSGFAGVYEDYKESMVNSAIQTLLVMLDYRPPGGVSEGCPENTFLRAMRTMNRSVDFDVVFEGLALLLNNVWEAENTTIPNSMYKIESYQEVLVLFWKLIEENKAFLKHILAKQDVNRILVPLLFFVYQGRRDPSKVGLLHVCTFTLLLLSGEREFAVQLNKPFKQKLPLDLPHFSGSHADLLFIVFHKLVVNGPEKLDSLYNCILTTIGNVSPYIKGLGQVASVKFLNLFELFASRRFIEAGPQNYQHAFMIIEALSNFIQYQYEGNHQLVYAIIRRRVVFEEFSKIPADMMLSEDAKKEGEDGEVKEEAAASGKDWKATPEWYASWKNKLPANLNTILRLLTAITPRVEDMCVKESVVGEDKILSFLKDFTIVGLLPVPHPILVRKYTQNELTDIWFTTFVWGVIYLRNQEPPLFDGEKVKLFHTIRQNQIKEANAAAAAGQ